MTICILGRQPGLALAELESVFGSAKITPVAPNVAVLDIPVAEVLQRPLGGVMKIGEIIDSVPTTSWETAGKRAVRHFQALRLEGKLTLGISAYNFTISPRDVQKTGLIIKQRLKKTGSSVRLIPNTESALNTAQVLHNKLGTAANKHELIVSATSAGQTLLALTKHVQDIEAYTFRDRSRPKRDAYVGMLPPKLAQTMINLVGAQKKAPSRLLDPFCGTGVVLQEAALLGYEVYGTDISDKMVRYTQENLDWLQRTHRISFHYTAEQADATTATWKPPVDAVVCETYLGKPLSSEPSAETLAAIKHECHTITKKFLENLTPQIAAGTRLCIAVPAWHTKKGIEHISTLDDLKNIGYNRIDFIHASREEMIYHREGQIVGRELLVLIKE
ncbi:MAG TPA: methyltransferase domain-containing protein [Verrucomicrobiae bacterium]|nr:methyltransferase domain-containing protein [Verrucomicrobiae bacterium]